MFLFHDRTGMTSRKIRKALTLTTSGAKDLQPTQRGFANQQKRVLAWPAFHTRSDNPVNWLLYSHLTKLGVVVDEFVWWKIVFGKADSWHLHWPERYLNDRSLVRAVVKSARLLSLMLVARMRRMTLVWTIHNLRSHENYHPSAERVFWRGFIALIDSYIALSPTSMRLARKMYPGLAAKRGVLSGHGSYSEEYPDVASKDEARKRLGLAPSANVICCFGYLRRYKGVLELLPVFTQIASKDVHLIVAGQPDSDETAQELERLAALDSRVNLRLGFQQPDELATIIRAADLVVLPFRSILHSGSAILALSLDRPVLAPSIGALPDLRRAAGKNWVSLYSGEIEVGVIASALTWVQEASRASPALGHRFTWAEVARRTAAAYE